ncbi:MAG: D-hexose-6-phosphate mutarotase [Chloroflexota bacterium]
MSVPSIIDVLNSQFGINGRLHFELGEGELPIARMTTDEATAVLSIYAGHVLSFVPHGSEDLLWVSQEAVYQSGKAIRGGIPVIWPWFGPHPTDSTKSSHGFARRQMWSVKASILDESGQVSLTLGLTENESTKAVWSHDFDLELSVTVGHVLTVQLKTTNSDDVPFAYTAALHTYYNISHISNVVISGLENSAYLDNLDSLSQHQQTGFVRFEEEVDRIYIDTTAPCHIEDIGHKRTIVVEKSGSRSTVVWNPWIEKAQRMSDFGDSEYQEMVCVETANAGNEIMTLEPGETAVMTLTVHENRHPDLQEEEH